MRYKMNGECEKTVAQYIISVAFSFNKFYHECTILQEENAIIKYERLKLVNVSQKVISEACNLLEMECLEGMYVYYEGNQN